MAYREPAVRVTEEFTNALPALAAFSLPHVNAGPTFQVVNQSQAGTYSGNAANYNYPDQIQGTYVDTRAADPTDLISFPVAVFLSNMVLEILDVSGTGSVNPYDLNQFTDATVNSMQNLLPGDVIVVSGSTMGNNGNYTVREKINNTTVRTNETFAAVESNLNYAVRRNVQSTVGVYQVPSSTVGLSISDTTVTLPIGLTYTLAPFGDCDIVSANVLISYRALRIEKSSDVWEYTDVSELQADFGTDQIVPENPAVFAASISLQTASVPTNLLAMNSDFLTNELLSYQNAFDVLGLTDMYAINVLSQMSAVHTALKAHCETLSLPENRLERIGICNRQLVTTASVTDEATDGVFSGSGNATFSSASGEFLTEGVVPGMYVLVTAPSQVKGRWKIGAVNSQTSITIATGVTIPAAATGVTFTIDKDLQKSEQAAVMAAYASSLGSRRLVLVWPDVVRGPVGSTVRDLPGYFLGATVGALTTGLPTQRGLTNLSIAYFSGVRHSTKYFNRDQMNTMAGGGIMIFVQDVLDVSIPYIRHQLTTDTSAVKFQEYSITKNVDFIAKFIRDNHKQFPGQYNIVDTTFDDLKSNAKGILTFLKDNTRLPKIGGVIKSGKLTSIKQDPANIDAIIEIYNLDIPIPLNDLDITIVV